MITSAASAGRSAGRSVGEHRRQDRPSQGVEHQVERDGGRAGAGGDAQGGDVNGMHHEEVPVQLIARRRCRTVLAAVPEIVGDVERPSRQVLTLAGSVSYTHLTLPTK